MYAGDVTSLATIPSNMEVEAQFLAKEDGIVAGISLAEMVFHEVDPSLKVLIFNLHFFETCCLFCSISSSKSANFSIRLSGSRKMGIVLRRD